MTTNILYNNLKCVPPLSSIVKKIYLNFKDVKLSQYQIQWINNNVSSTS
jgi:hypothetical protein